MGALAGKVTLAHAELDPREVVIPEWDMTLYVFPITLRQFSEIREAGTDADMWLRAIRIRGKRSDGSPALDAVDTDALMSHGAGDKYGLKVVQRVFVEVMSDVTGINITDEVIDEAEKK